MKEKELNEIFALLRRAGMGPVLCDTAVLYTEQAVKAGIPTAPGDGRYDEYIMLPKDMVGKSLTCAIDVEGDSMADLGIRSGDRLVVLLCDTAQDGDIVVASVDGECTVKAYWQDGEGRRWLVPSNEAYKPILLREDMNVRILGRVLEHIRQTPRIPTSELMRTVKKAQRESTPLPDASDMQAEARIQRVAAMVRCKRQWYAVYRALVDLGLVGEEMYHSFVDMVQRTVPSHKHLPSVDALRRMAVQSFRRPVHRWDPKDAPVSGHHFEVYVRIAKAVKGVSF